MVQINNFSLGLVTKISPYLLDGKASIELQNADISTGKIKSFKDFGQIPVEIDKYAHFFRGQWFSKPTETYFAEYKERLYFTGTNLSKFYKGEELSTSLPKPTNLRTTTKENLNEQTVSFIHTYYRQSDGLESVASDVLEGKWDKLDIVFDSKPGLINRLYRAGKDNYILFKETDQSTLSIDAKEPTDFTSAFTATDYYPAPENMKFLTERNSIGFGCVKDLLYFSKPTELDYWPRENFIRLPDDITGIANCSNGLLIFTAYSTHLLLGSRKDKFNLNLISDTIGCLHHDTIAGPTATPMWVTSDRLDVVSYSAGRISPVMSKILDYGFKEEPVQAIYHNSIYYLLMENNTVLIIDLSDKLRCSHFKSDETIQRLIAYDNLYGVGVNRNLFKFNIAKDLTFNYTSPKFSEGSLALKKSYQEIQVYFIGEGEITVYVDDVEAGKSQLKTGVNTLETYRGLNMGYYIQFKITGKGELLELAYIVNRGNDG